MGDKNNDYIIAKGVDALLGSNCCQKIWFSQLTIVGIQQCWVVYVWHVPFIGVLSETVQVVW